MIVIHLLWTFTLSVYSNGSCDDLLRTCVTAIIAVRDWLGGVRRGRFDIWTSTKEKEAQWEKELARLCPIRDELFSALRNFRKDKRYPSYGSALHKSDVKIGIGSSTHTERLLSQT